MANTKICYFNSLLVSQTVVKVENILLTSLPERKTYCRWIDLLIACIGFLRDIDSRSITRF